MKMTEIRPIAKQMGLKTSRVRKADLIRTIQTTEGNFDCFGSATDYCDRTNCCWRTDCLGKSRA